MDSPYLLTRHPELVSGPMSPPDAGPSGHTQPNRSVSLLPHAPAHVARWALKQVQGDEFGLVPKGPVE
jgi:hypothetical protein